ncbi:hypothetical protein WMY93_002806 [Mugilogobius chulae]|uniref:SCAN box domain-containing protein n=1 Tax=Mugilogobius chulae TaxID=88201 RepID=A0AAW0PWI6_9GOBI
MAAAAPRPDQEEEAWATDEEEEEENLPSGTSSAQGGGLLAMMQCFLEGQQRREEGLLAELRGLRASLPQYPPEPPEPRSPPALRGPRTSTSSTWTAVSPRLDLPTPAPRRQHRQSTEEQPRPEARLCSDPKIPQYENGEDIENYLLRFERIAKTWAWPENEWACRLVPLLSGKALEAYSAMDEERAHSYVHLKEALLAKFDISPETYRRQFRSTAVPPGENYAETYHRLKGLYRRWIRPEEHTKEEIGEAIILEQFLRILPGEICTWVKEHEPTEGLAAAKLAQQYLNARKGGSGHYPTNATRRPAPPPRTVRREVYPESAGNLNPATTRQGTGKELICFYCQQPGHKAALCPIRKAKLTGACYVPRSEGKTETVMRRYKKVTVNGQTVEALLDSGSSLSLVRQDFVPMSAMDYSKSEDILCVHGDKHPYPTADLTVTLRENAEADCNTETLSCPVVTRAQAKACVQPQTNLDSGLDAVDTQGSGVEVANAQPFALMEDSIFEGGTKGPKKSRRQRRFEKQLMAKQPDLNYATRFPEAFPLRTITAPAVVRALFSFSPGSWGSQPSRQHPIIHKPTDWLNALTKPSNECCGSLLQIQAKTGIAGYPLPELSSLPYREVPQASTGFSPFELLYGWDVQGPLDLLRKRWEAPSIRSSDRSIVQYVLEMRDRLSKYQEEANLNLSEAQKSQKTWYDQQARRREFQPGREYSFFSHPQPVSCWPSGKGPIRLSGKWVQ